MQNIVEDYLKYNPKEDLDKFSTVSTESWRQLGEIKALENFHKTSKTVPAYKDFLKINSINPENIKTIEDFQKVPLITKENYIRKYPLKMLAENGDLNNAVVYFMTSGSTGKSFYWPRPSDLGSLKGVELLLKYYFDLGKKKTLLINCFAMGPWGAGEVFHFSTKLAGIKGLNITVISPGTNIELFINIFKDLAGEYEQIVITGYSSFLKDLIDTGSDNGINFSNHKVGLITGGEKYSEKWRKYILQKLGVDNDYKVIASVYGTSEGAVVGISSTFTDYLRSYLSNNSNSSVAAFDRNDLPSYVHFIPPLKYIETVENEIIMTTTGIVPLIRYNSKDNGTVLNPTDLIKNLPPKFIDNYKNLTSDPLFNLPIVTIDGRSDKTIILFGANIYPEQIQESLETDKLINLLTGRFIAEKLETSNNDPYLKVIVELKPSIKPSKILSLEIREEVSRELSKLNSEYNNVLNSSGPKAKPTIELKEYKSPEISIISGKGVLVKN